MIGGTYTIGNSDGTWSKITYSELIVDSRWTPLDPEFARRILGIIDRAQAGGYKAYIGPTYRSDATQRSQFLTRFYGVSFKDSETVTWSGLDNNGRAWNYWKKIDPAYATIAPPGRSYHAQVTKNNKSLAVDIMGYEADRTFLRSVATSYGLYMSVDPTDPHHFQPAEVPVAKKYYNPVTHVLTYFSFGGYLTTPSGTAVIPNATQIYAGSTNIANEVLKLQNIMKYWGWYTGALNGSFDLATYSSVKKMQTFLKATVSNNTITINGDYDSATRSAYYNYINGLSIW